MDVGGLIWVAERMKWETHGGDSQCTWDDIGHNGDDNDNDDDGDDDL